MEKYSSLKENLYLFFNLFKKLLSLLNSLLTIGMSIFTVVVIWFVLSSVSSVLDDIEYAQQPTEIIEVSVSKKAVYLNRGGWLVSQDFVVANPPKDFAELKKFVEKFEQGHPLNPEDVIQVLENEKKAMSPLGVDMYTEAQKQDGRVTYSRNYYRKFEIMPKSWDKRIKQDDYKAQRLFTTYDSIVGFDKIDWLIAIVERERIFSQID